MMYMYVFPVEGFERDMPDSELMKACFSGGEVKRYAPEAFAGLLNDESINPDNYWVRAMDDDKGFYPVSFLHRDDLKAAGFDAENVSEADMERLAGKMGGSFTDCLFWVSLETLAADMGIPRLKEPDAGKNHENQSERAS